MEKLTNDELNNVTREEWVKCIKCIKKLQKDDFVKIDWENIVKPVIIYLQDGSEYDDADDGEDDNDVSLLAMPLE